MKSMNPLVLQQLLDTMPKSSIPEIQEEIQEIHSKIKTDGIPKDGNFFVFYTSYISQLSRKITNKLSRGYRELFEKAICNVFPHNPYEHPNSAIEREIERVERGFKAVHAKKVYLRKFIHNMKFIQMEMDSVYQFNLYNSISSILDEMFMYDERELLLDFIPILLKKTRQGYYMIDKDKVNIIFEKIILRYPHIYLKKRKV
jgi:hypothetical protein